MNVNIRQLHLTIVQQKEKDIHHCQSKILEHEKQNEQVRKELLQLDKSSVVSLDDLRRQFAQEKVELQSQVSGLERVVNYVDTSSVLIIYRIMMTSPCMPC